MTSTPSSCAPRQNTLSGPPAWSYRSAFLARKATDALPAGATGAVAAPSSRRGSTRAG